VAKMFWVGSHSMSAQDIGFVSVYIVINTTQYSFKVLSYSFKCNTFIKHPQIVSTSNKWTIQATGDTIRSCDSLIL
jgi:hypothetical protein